MKTRIVLSIPILLVLVGSSLFGIALAIGVHDARAQGVTANGIGTSPSRPADDQPLELATCPPPAPPDYCAFWVRGSELEADSAALAGEPPDFAQTANRHITCADLVNIAWMAWPNAFAVRYADLAYRARGAK